MYHADPNTINIKFQSTAHSCFVAPRKYLKSEYKEEKKKQAERKDHFHTCRKQACEKPWLLWQVPSGLLVSEELYAAF